MPVLIAGTLNLPRHAYDPYDSAYANPAKLHAAGVTIAIHSRSGGSGGGETAARNLPVRSRHGRRLRLAGGCCAQGRHDHAGTDPGGRRPGRVARNRQTGQHRRDGRATCSSRRRPCSRSSSTASRCGPRAVTPSSTRNTAAGWTRFGPAARGSESTKPRPSSPAAGTALAGKDSSRASIESRQTTCAVTEAARMLGTANAVAVPSSFEPLAARGVAGRR